MNQETPPRKRVLDAVELQAYDWVRRIESGKMTHAEGAQLKRWRQADPSHAAMLTAARRKWVLLGEAAVLAAAGDSVNAPANAAAKSGFAVANGRRRAFLGAAAGLTTAAVAAAVVYPPLDLWPSVGEWRADYRTAIGERRQLALADNVAVELNTRTSVAVMQDRDGTPGIDLIAGETAIDMLDARRPFAVAAGAARMLASEARFEVRRTADGVCVTCLQGQVRIAHPAGTAVLNARQQMTYDDRALHPVAAIDPAQVSAWREGFLRFRDTPLEQVIDEINRYRPGRVVLLNRRIAGEAVTARFRIDALDKAIAQMQRSLALDVRSLPGGVVLLS
jgi:transmembrane sensor